MNKLIIHSHESLRFVPHSEITYCKSDNCYTSIFLDNGEELIMCKSLKKLLAELDPTSFIRVNQSYLINKNFIKIIDKKNKYVELINNQRIPFTTTIAELLSLIVASFTIACINLF
ncbi:LytTR family transcriptional regulator [Pedobacter sp. HDW13]|uniref:LytR/AlgR family response regulator transcription factor n=1 Tax=Pedobacter sp. HDW13 TaxID=2714940 RepID=UPI00140D5A9E|nr:LytTR family DNA-binding domain-containing protein [Pedobacter sp. HDW13]QIL41614.1 LytTR family transcriptional regulator [Pedobacter sp. HDW13]